ncbi:hypothetical protein CB0940_00418 [Cercospora beticola]|uniref:Peptidyl-tRNA hydrolase n=2 Tax=Cercospora TaxID=29002 RepID=A0A2G5IA62_CERBT|nr:hypothetical protein CB0940_00418 [Cercospora beticola]XP_044655124.1 uncharacterized protein CKM354_000396600 [Cercospora kikuchii]PIB01688.1 hypothetical protein CB0940_00418 [Cercospora beticola]WPA95835.1 hypothetical protein RHO25_000438 [Cercospora beticola]GIZ40637.1 hypothetical protein CKM354_000396600 [Cercospora kikuchii]
MRASNLILVLPALAAAQEQIPMIDQLKGWFAKATASVSTAVEKATQASIPDPVAAAAAKVADLKVERLTLDNHKELIQPGSSEAAPGIQTWEVFVTGGNKTCYGRCARAETAFNESVALVAASPNPPNLALLNCETDGVLCHAWAVSPPTVLHLQLPQPLADQSTPASTVRSIRVNTTTVTAADIAAIHLQEKYLETEPYEGFFHPFDGPLAQYGLTIPFGYLVWGFSQIPSWMFMIGISFFSRTIMGRRMAPPAQRGDAPAAAQ